MSWERTGGDPRWTTPYRAERAPLDVATLDAMPEGAVYEFDLGALRISAGKTAYGRWQVHTRTVGSADLAGFPAVERVLRAAARRL